MFPYDTMSGIPADSAIEQIRGLTTALQQAQAKRAQRQGRARIGAMVGSRLDPMETQAINDAAIATQAQRLGIDPRVALGDRAGRGMMQPPAAPTRAPMGRDVLAERLAQMAQSDKYGGQYTNFPKVKTEQDGVPRSYRVVAGRPESMENRPPATFVTESSNGRGMALVGRLPQERLDAIAAQRAEALGKAGDKTLLEVARQKRKEKNVTRMLSSRNPAVRARGMELADAIRKREGGLVQDEGVDVEAARREGQKVFNATGDSALARQTMMDDINRQRAVAEAKRRRAEEKEDKEADRKFQIERERARFEADLDALSDPRVVRAEAIRRGLPDEEVERLVAQAQRARAAGAVGAGTVLAPRPPVDMGNPLPRATGPAMPRPFSSAGAPPLPAMPAGAVPMPIKPNGTVHNTELSESDILQDAMKFFFAPNNTLFAPGRFGAMGSPGYLRGAR